MKTKSSLSCPRNLPELFHDADDRRRYVPDVDLLPERVADELELLDDAGSPTTATLAPVGEVDLRQEPAALHRVVVDLGPITVDSKDEGIVLSIPRLHRPASRGSEE